MKETIERINILRTQLDEIKTRPQDAKREIEIELLNLEITGYVCAVRKIAAERAAILLRAWTRTGQMDAIRPDGSRRTGNTVVTSNPVYNAWNARNEAHALACWSLGAYDLCI